MPAAASRCKSRTEYRSDQGKSRNHRNRAADSALVPVAAAGHPDRRGKVDYQTDQQPRRARGIGQGSAQAVGEPITSSSANISGNPAVVSVNQLDEELIASVMGILDEPPVPAGGLPSTLVERMEDGRLRLLRAGAVTSAQIAEAGFEVVEEE